MNRIFTFVAVVAVGLSIMGMGLGPVAGQETAANETATPTATIVPTTSSAPTPSPTTRAATTAPTRTATATTATTTTAAPTPTATDSPRSVRDQTGDVVNETKDALNLTTPTPSPTPAGTPSSQTAPTETPTATRNASMLSGDAVDEQTALTNWRHSEGTFTLTFRYLGERPRTVTLTESTQPEEGATRFSTTEERLLPGSNTFTMTTRIEGGESAVSITTQASREEGYGIVISTGRQGNDPFAPYGGTSGVLSGVGISMLLSGGAAAFVIWREESGVIEA